MDLFARSCAAALHQDGAIRNIDVKQMHFPIRSLDFTLVGEDDVAVIHVALIWTNFL